MTRRRRFGWIALLLVLALLGAAAVAAALLLGWAGHGLDQLQVVVDGQPVELPPLSGWHALAAGGGLLVALLVLAVVVPLALLFGLALPVVVLGLLAAGVVVLALGIGLLLAAPLAVPVALLAWWLLRRQRRTDARAGAVRPPDAPAAAGPPG